MGQNKGLKYNKNKLLAATRLCRRQQLKIVCSGKHAKNSSLLNILSKKLLRYVEENVEQVTALFFPLPAALGTTEQRRRKKQDR